MPRFRYIQDPGHGWIEVPRQRLRELDIEYNISAYSYVDKGKAYLEEDCDMPLFLAKWKAAHGTEPELVEVVVDSDAFVRNLPRYPMTRPAVA